MKKVSFVILSYNSEKFLKDCIMSIIGIKGYLKDIYIIDNASTDKSIEIIKQIQKESDDITLIELDKNYGTTISRNKGLHSIKKTDYICILDSDTIINENAIDIMAKYLEKHQDAGIVGPAMVDINGIEQRPYRKFPTWKIKLCKAMPIKKISVYGEQLENYDKNEMTDEFECDYIISACWMLRFDVYKKLGDLDEKIFYSPEDVEYCMRARENGFKIVHLRKAQIIHYYQRISKKKLISKTNFTHLIGIHYVLKKYKKFLRNYKIGDKKIE